MDPIPIVNCDLELALSPPSSSSRTTAAAAQQFAIVNHGVIAVADFTERQVRAIIMQASRQTEARRMTCRIRAEDEAEKATESVGSVSMKRSLQRFLQKRKHRIQALSPYNR